MNKAPRIPSPLGRLAAAAAVFVVSALHASVSHADAVEKLIQILKTNDSYKVRMTAAIGLGKKKDKRAVPALIFALRDSEYAVRALAAAALGRIGDRRAAPSLKALIKRESNGFVKSQAKKALAAVSGRGPSGTPISSAKVYIRVGKVSNPAGIGGSAISSALGAALIRQFSKVPKVATSWPGGKPTAAQLRRRKIKGFVLDGSVMKLTSKPSGGSVEISCFIRVSLATYPQNSMKAFYSGGASMTVSQREFSSSKVSLFKELVVATAGGARQQIVNSYLSRMIP